MYNKQWVTHVYFNPNLFLLNFPNLFLIIRFSFKNLWHYNLVRRPTGLKMIAHIIKRNKMMSDFWGKARRGAHPISLRRLLDYLTDPSVRTGWNKSSSHEPPCNIMLVRVGAWIFSPLLRSEQLCGWVTWPSFQSIIERSATLPQSHCWLISKDKTPEVEASSEQMMGKQSHYKQP